MRYYLVGIALLCVACGGGGDGGGGGGDGVRTAVLYAEPTLDGLVDSAGWVCFSPTCSVPSTGDYGATFPAHPGYSSRQLYAFDLSPLPAGTTILSATLRVYQAHVLGSPYTKLGDVVVDHVDYFAVQGAPTFDDQVIDRRIGTISTDPSLGPRTLKVTGEVTDDRTAGSLWTMFRLYFYTPLPTFADGADDRVYFTDAEGSGSGWYGEVPQLIIRYQ